MGKSSRSKRKSLEMSDNSSSPSRSSSSSFSDSDSSDSRRRRRRRRLSRHREESSFEKKKTKRHHHRKKRLRKRDESKRKRRESYSSDDDVDDEPEALVRSMLDRFPKIASDLEQLLQMIDNGQGVDVKGISNKSLVRQLKRLFFSLKLKQNESGVFILPPHGHLTLDIIGPLLRLHLKSIDNHHANSEAPIREQSLPYNLEQMKTEVDTETAIQTESHVKLDSPKPTRRSIIGPEMPSRELLAAASELAEAETLLREADLEADNGLLIGPPPPAMVAEAETANEAERFEEVARIASAETEKPYDVLGVNWKMSSDNIKKRYWKLSLMVHPDKCSHPQAHQAFVKLNQAFKDLQDPTKRKDIDEKIKLKEEQEAFKVELRELREAAQWRQSQGISMEGDEEILAMTKEAEVPKRDEWMTTLPPEKKPGMSMQSRSFSKTTKEGRGDTSTWTDGPLDRAEKAKQNYLEAYNRTRALGESEERKKSTDADLVDKYNSSKRSTSLVQKHQLESRKNAKKSKKQQSEKGKEKEEWVGQHPWKPWDRENDLTAGRKKVNLDSGGMAQGLSSRFSSGTVQRNFL